MLTERRNSDGTLGEYFTKATEIDSPYTDVGILYIDWEHGRDVDTDGNNPDNVLGYVDWKTAKVDDKGIKVNRILNRRNKYVQILEKLMEKGLLGTSSMPIQTGVVKAVDGEIKKWPLCRDSLTVTPMEWRMVGANTLKLVKSLADELERDNLTHTSLYKSLEMQQLNNQLELEIELAMELLKRELENE